MAAAPEAAQVDFLSSSDLLEAAAAAAAALPAAADASLLAPLEAALVRLPQVRVLKLHAIQLPFSLSSSLLK